MTYTAEQLRQAASLIRDLNVIAGSNLLADKLELQAIEADRVEEHKQIRDDLKWIVYNETDEDHRGSEFVANALVAHLVDKGLLSSKYRRLEDVPAKVVVRDAEGEYWFHEGQNWYMTMTKDVDQLQDRTYYSGRSDADLYLPFYRTDWKIND